MSDGKIEVTVSVTVTIDITEKVKLTPLEFERGCIDLSFPEEKYPDLSEEEAAQKVQRELAGKLIWLNDVSLSNAEFDVWDFSRVQREG